MKYCSAAWAQPPGPARSHPVPPAHADEHTELLHGQQQRWAGTKQAAMHQEVSDKAGSE